MYSFFLQHLFPFCCQELERFNRIHVNFTIIVEKKKRKRKKKMMMLMVEMAVVILIIIRMEK